MSTILKNIITFSDLVVGVPTSLPHGLNLNDLKLTPQLIGADAAGFTLTANDTNVIATRTDAAASGDVGVYVEHWHTIEEALPLPGKLTGLTPFVLAAGGGDQQYASARVRDTGVAYATHGCSTAKTGSGQYHVTLSPAFPDDVAVTALINEDHAAIYGIYAINVTNAGFDIVIRGNTDGFIFEDAAWSFIARPATSAI